MDTKHAIGPQELDIHLRRRAHIERAAGRTKRLGQSLRALGAKGVATKPLPPGSQQAFVKVTLPPSGGRTTRQHLGYLQWKKGVNKTQAHLYGPGALNPAAFAQRARDDGHQFRMIVSMKHDILGDQRPVFIAALVAQMERDLGRQLDWLAADHYDRPHPHTHVVIRGQAQGEPLYMARHYFEHGIREQASRLLTMLLGPWRTEQYHQEVQHRLAQEDLVRNGIVRTSTDADLEALQRVPTGRMVAGQVPDRTPHPRPTLPFINTHEEHQRQSVEQQRLQREAWMRQHQGGQRHS